MLHGVEEDFRTRMLVCKHGTTQCIGAYMYFAQNKVIIPSGHSLCTGRCNHDIRRMVASSIPSQLTGGKFLCNTTAEFIAGINDWPRSGFEVEDPLPLACKFFL